MKRSSFKVACFLLCLSSALAYAGGPLIVGGPTFGIDGQPFIWNPAKMPIQYRVDPGPMATTQTGGVAIGNADGLQRVAGMFSVWQGVSTASLSFSNAGALLPAGSYSGGDLRTVQQYNDMSGSCRAGQQSPVIFDSDGTLMTGLGLPQEVIGMTGICATDSANGYITAAIVTLNGKFQDGLDSPSTSNYELTANQFDETISHEIGHFIGLGHSQINLDLFTGGTYPCSVDDLAGVPLMFPEEFCQARKDAGLPVLSPDDMTWVSKLYPSANQVSEYATISGYIYSGDGVSQIQGVNVIARAVDDPTSAVAQSRRIAVSAISGYLFTGNPGQSVTADMADPNEHNTGGWQDGSRNPQLIGYYEISVPPGTYTVEVESIFSSFQSDSGIGPLDPPVTMPGGPEFWNQDESAFDFPMQRDTITVHGGDKITNTNIILNYRIPRFDDYEDDGAFLDPPVLSPIQHEEGARA